MTIHVHASIQKSTVTVQVNNLPWITRPVKPVHLDLRELKATV